MSQRERPAAALRLRVGAPADEALPFYDQFAALFESGFGRLRRVMTRLSGEPEMATDLVQEAFVRLYRRGSLPRSPEAWLITVAMNLFRNERSSRQRHLRLLTSERGEAVMAGPPAAPEQTAASSETRRRVRAALDRLPEREQRLLLLQAEGFAYRDIAAALELNQASVGTLLARARRAFRKSYEGSFDAS